MGAATVMPCAHEVLDHRRHRAAGLRLGPAVHVADGRRVAAGRTAGRGCAGRRSSRARRSTGRCRKSAGDAAEGRAGDARDVVGRPPRRRSGRRRARRAARGACRRARTRGRRGRRPAGASTARRRASGATCPSSLRTYARRSPWTAIASTSASSAVRNSGAAAVEAREALELAAAVARADDRAVGRSSAGRYCSGPSCGGQQPRLAAVGGDEVEVVVETLRVGAREQDAVLGQVADDVPAPGSDLAALAASRGRGRRGRSRRRCARCG